MVNAFVDDCGGSGGGFCKEAADSTVDDVAAETAVAADDDDDDEPTDSSDMVDCDNLMSVLSTAAAEIVGDMADAIRVF